MFLETGLRGTEIDYFIENYDSYKVEINGEVVVYPIYYQRGNKNSYYMFISKELFDEVLNNLDELKKFKPSNVKSLIKKKDLVSLKYLRKYQFTQMIKAEISFEIANFIRGRASKNIGFNHYLAKKELALREYEKVI